MPRSNGFVTADLFGDETAARQLYYWPPLKDFLRDCLGKPELFIYEDPVSNMIVNVGAPGQQFNWHFDTNEFTITMLLQEADSGGHFEYVPNLRTPEDERYDPRLEGGGADPDRIVAEARPGGLDRDPAAEHAGRGRTSQVDPHSLQVRVRESQAEVQAAGLISRTSFRCSCEQLRKRSSIGRPDVLKWARWPFPSMVPNPSMAMDRASRAKIRQRSMCRSSLYMFL